MVSPSARTNHRTVGCACPRVCGAGVGASRRRAHLGNHGDHHGDDYPCSDPADTYCACGHHHGAAEHPDHHTDAHRDEHPNNGRNNDADTYPIEHRVAYPVERTAIHPVERRDALTGRRPDTRPRAGSTTSGCSADVLLTLISCVSRRFWLVTATMITVVSVDFGGR